MHTDANYAQYMNFYSTLHSQYVPNIINMHPSSIHTHNIRCIISMSLQHVFCTVRCEKHVANNETRWCIQVNSTKISLLTEVFA